MGLIGILSSALAKFKTVFPCLRAYSAISGVTRQVHSMYAMSLLMLSILTSSGCLSMERHKVRFMMVTALRTGLWKQLN